MVVPSATLLEARFLGCEVISNDNAGVCGEPWWRLPHDLALEVARDAPARFWRIVEDCAARKPADRASLEAAARSMRGKGVAYGVDKVLTGLERVFVPRRWRVRAEQQLEQRSMDARVVATPHA